MAVRRRMLRPDTFVDTDTYGPVPVVSDDVFLNAVIAAAQTQALAGGVLTVLVDRHPTDLEHERVTTQAIIEWKDRTDAKAQPERIDPLPEQAPPPAREPEPELPPAAVEEPVAAEPGSTVDDIGDGLDAAALEDEDVSSVPEALR